ncbi:MAG: patatin-like phospholipase family protein [Gammaproteobacteria bacterium]
MSTDQSSKKIGLLLAGGGARAAYQVGMLKAISTLLPRRASNPFQVISGTSAGAINGTALAIYSSNFHTAVHRLVSVWENFHAAMMFGGLGRYNPHSLLDRSPLSELLQTRLAFDRIQTAIDEGHLHALGVTCSGYISGQSVTFYQGSPMIPPWRRARRIGYPAKIGLPHILASSAIPMVFSAVKINHEYFGDGSMRQIAPISPALHLGADRILIVGARDQPYDPSLIKSDTYPPLAQIAGHVLNSIFLDSLEADLERLDRVNKTVSLIPSHHLTEGNTTLRHVDVLVITPSQELDDIAARHAKLLPRTIRFLLKRIGATTPNGANLISYLLFEQEYCRELISLGYHDALARKDEILAFLDIAPVSGINGDAAWFTNDVVNRAG